MTTVDGNETAQAVPGVIGEDGLGDVPRDIEARVFRTLIDLMPDRIYAKDAQSRFIMCNKAVARLMGKATTEEMIGKDDFHFYARALASEYFEVEQALLRSGQSVIACEQLVPNLETGEPGWLQTTKVPLRDDDGRVIGLVGLARDITERKRFEAEIQQRNAELAELNEKLSKAQEQLMQAEKLAAIGHLAAGVAHEINNPIGFISSNFNTLDTYIKKFHGLFAAFADAQRHIGDPEVVAQLDRLRKDADLEFLLEDSGALMTETREGLSRVTKIVKDLKDFSRIDATAEWSGADLHLGIDSTLNILANEIRYKADVVKSFGEIPEVECIASQINQVIMNLVVNALDAIGPERGTITVRTGAGGSDDGEVPQVWFEVSDTGCGIAKEALPRIFDPFFTTKAVGKGTGLGLSLSYGIVQGHDGRIDVSSEPGSGTTFRVSLPVRHRKA